MLSKRLLKVADLVSKGSNVVDVGCEHALLDIYLTLNKSVKCIATDINENSIKVAKANIEKYKLSNDITLVRTNGLHNIDSEDVDTIIIAGLGTKSILKILKDYYFETLIIQSNNDLEQLRLHIIKKGYIIQKEEIVYEHQKYYVIIKFVKGYQKYKYIDYFIGPIISLNQREIDHQYINYLLEIHNKLIIRLPKKCIVSRLYTNYKKYLLLHTKGKK